MSRILVGRLTAVSSALGRLVESSVITWKAEAWIRSVCLPCRSVGRVRCCAMLRLQPHPLAKESPVDDAVADPIDVDSAMLG